MDEKKSFDLAITLDSMRLVDEFFHVNPPTGNTLQSGMFLTIPQKQVVADDKVQRLRLHAVVGVRFSLMPPDAKPAPEGQTADGEALSFGTALDITVSSGFMGDAIPLGKHASWTGKDLESERDRRMVHNLLLECLKAGYSFASARLLEVSSLSPYGPISLPLPDYEELLRDIEEKD